jgi:predicted ATPase
MAQNVEIRNFRCFKSAKLSDCRRINVIVGENGAGKTALMEAIFLAVALSPEIPLRFRTWRGVDQTRMSGDFEAMERAFWGDMFHNRDFNQPIAVGLKGPREHERSLTVTYQGRQLADKSGLRKPITFLWKGQNEKLLHRALPQLESDGKITLEGMPPKSSISTSFFSSNATYSSSELVGRFSELSKKSRDDEISARFREHFKEVKDLSIEVHGGMPLLFARLQGSEEKVPITSISGGMNKLAAVLFAIPSMAGGIIFIDEIENGFYYKRLPEIWRSIAHFADAYEVQVFASTHSEECLRAAASTAANAPETFSLIRSVKIDGTTALRQFSGRDFVDAIEEHVEVR